MRHSFFPSIGGWDALKKVAHRYRPIGGNERQVVILAEVVKTNDIFLLFGVNGTLSYFRREGAVHRMCTGVVTNKG